MNDDIRPPKRPPLSTTVSATKTPPLNLNPVPLETDTPAIVDEEKIVKEFGPPPNEPFPPRPKIFKLLPARFRRSYRKRDVILGTFGVVVVIVASVTSYLILHHYKPSVAEATTVIHKKIVPKPVMVPSMLSGLPVDPSVNNRPVTAVMIENSDAARPQSALDQASVVFEAVAEGGVTRFMALFQDTQPDYIGPVRSARPYYIEWALGFDAAYAHVGGSPDALQDISTWHVKDLNEFYNAGGYERISSRQAPHNVYTSIAQLNQVESSKGFTSSHFSGFVRKKDAPAKTPTASSIDMSLSYVDFAAHYDYNPPTNTYKRSEGGAPHIELNKDGSQVQIAPKVVVAMIVPESQGALDSTGAYYSDYTVIGTGQVFVFQDGTVTPGTWTKSSDASQITFTDANGKPLPLNAGQTWISALSSTNNLSYH